MPPISVVDIVAAVILAIVGNGLLGKFLLQRQNVDHETKLTRLRTELESDIRKMQSALDRTVVIHRAQFEIEFAALRDIWTKVAAVRASMGTVRPQMQLIDANEKPEEKDSREFECFKSFNNDLNALIHSVDSQSPFVPRDIYRELETLLKVARGEAIEVRVERQDRERGGLNDWYKRGREHYQQLCDSATAVSDLIRVRLESLTVAVREN